MPDEKGRSVDRVRVAMQRRRAGRRYVVPQLIGMLRRPAGDGARQEGDAPELIRAFAPGSDPMSSARGIAMGLVLSVPVWGCFGAVGFALS